VSPFPHGCEDVRARAREDGLVDVGPNPWIPGSAVPDCPPGFSLVALAVKPDRTDFHWYRRNADGTWSHKPGQTPARFLLTDLGAPSTDPSTADRGVFTIFCGYMCVPSAPILSGGGPWGDGATLSGRVEHAGVEDLLSEMSVKDEFTVATLLPTGPAVPDPQWEDLAQSGDGGFAVIPRPELGLPSYIAVRDGIVAFYDQLQSPTITFYNDDQGLEAFLDDLHLLPPPNDGCGASLAMADGPTEFTTRGATDSEGLGGFAPGECDSGDVGDGDIAADIWYEYASPCSGRLSVITCGNVDFDSKIAVYQVTDCPQDNSFIIACAEDDELGSTGTCDEGGTYLADVAVEEGVIYRIRLGGANGESGSGIVSVTCVPTEHGRCCWEETPACPADITGPSGGPDGNVDALDFLVLISQWGMSCEAGCIADFNGAFEGVPDGVVNALDLLMMIAQWGTPAICGQFETRCDIFTEAECDVLEGTFTEDLTCDTPCDGQ
jgi:hypothetical protein